MALIACAECGREISSLASACPGCGCPTPGPESAIENVPAPRPHVRVTLESPDSLGSVVAHGARKAAGSSIWGKLFSTAMFFAWLWAVGWVIAAALALKERHGDQAIVSFLLGIAPVVGLEILGKWFKWLRS